MPDFSSHSLGLNHVVLRPGAVRLSETAALRSPTWRKQVNYHAGLVLGNALGNDNAGNCVTAGSYRMAQMRTHAAQGSDWAPTAAEALGLYSQITGYNSADPSTDNGTNVPMMMSWWAQKGLDLGLQVPDVQWPHVTVDPGKIADELQCAIDWFGGVGLSLALPNYIKIADEWDVAGNNVSSSDAAPGSWGGHYVPAGRYDTTTYWVITWGVEVLVTPAFLNKYLLAIDTGVSRLWADTSGNTPSGFSIGKLATTRMP